MVRLVFRPYTHVRRTICTSVSLRASIRVSPDFTLRRHSSPSFGSYRTRSYSIHPTGSADAALMASLTFIPRDGFSTFTLACTLDSLVRVSRRVGKGHFDRIARSSSSRAPTGAARFRRSNCLTPPLRARRSIRPQTSGHPVAEAKDQPLRLLYSSTASFSTVSGLLTFFSNCFSSFLHSTCSLSVSHIYLALEEVYLPLRAAIQNNPTLR